MSRQKNKREFIEGKTNSRVSITACNSSFRLIKILQDLYTKIHLVARNEARWKSGEFEEFAS